MHAVAGLYRMLDVLSHHGTHAGACTISWLGSVRSEDELCADGPPVALHAPIVKITKSVIRLPLQNLTRDRALSKHFALQ